jgi:type I restriction enzyme S subunit
MGEIGEFYGGLSGKSKEDFSDGNAIFASYMSIFSNIALVYNDLPKVKIAPNEKQKSIRYGDILFTGSSETPDECGMSCAVTTHYDEPVYLNSFSFGFRLYDMSILLPEFAKFLFRSKYIRQQIKLTASGVTRFNVSKKKMEKVVIPIPSLETQHAIVAILDRFDALTSDLTQGLPAEIAARQRQYEYYRDRLLTFREKSA